jgi:hypothetical protein
MLPQALLSILIIDLTFLCVVQRLVRMVDLCKVLCCFLLFLISASHFVCTRSNTTQAKAQLQNITANTRHCVLLQQCCKAL